MAKWKDKDESLKIIASHLTEEVKKISNKIQADGKTINELNTTELNKIQTLFLLRDYLQETTSSWLEKLLKWALLIAVFIIIGTTFLFKKKGLKYSGSITCNSLSGKLVSDTLSINNLQRIRTKSIQKFRFESPYDTLLLEDRTRKWIETRVTEYALSSSKERERELKDLNPKLAADTIAKRANQYEQTIYKRSNICLSNLNSSRLLLSRSGKSLDIQLEHEHSDSSIYLKYNTQSQTCFRDIGKCFEDPTVIFQKGCLLRLTLAESIIKNFKDNEFQLSQLEFLAKNSDAAYDESSILEARLSCKEIDQDIQLYEGDNLSIDITINRGSISMLNNGNLTLQLVDASINSLSVNGKNRLPSLFIFYYKNHEFKFQIGIILFLFTYMTKLWTVLKDLRKILPISKN